MKNMKKIDVVLRKKQIIVGIILLISICFLVCNTKIREERNNYALDGENTVDDISYPDVSVDKQMEIQQWYLKNNGSFNTFIHDDEAWRGDEKKAKSDIDIDYEKGIQMFSSKRTAIVAVIDTEIDTSHYALQNNVLWKNAHEIENDNIDNDNNGYIDDYTGWNFCDKNNILYNKNDRMSNHGTHITGILGGNDSKHNFKGMFANGVNKVMCIKALNEDQGKIEDIIAAIEYAESNGAMICCMALSSYIDDESLKKVMRDSNMLFVVPAGNDGMELEELPVYPAAYNMSNIISVADIRPDGMLSNTSNYGVDIIDIAAPGTDIISTIGGGEYGCLSGTSPATAIVAGVASLIYCHAEKELAASDIIKIMKDSSKKIKGLEDKVVCGGIVSLYNALKQLEK